MPAERLSVTILTQYFYPEVPGAAQIITDLALGLTDAGFDVRVYAGQPAYVEGRRLPSRETYRGVRIHRAYSRRLSRSGTGSRLLNSATVAAVTLPRVLFRRKPDVFIVDSTSLFMLVVAWLLHRLRGAPFIFLSQDVYPELAVRLGVVRRNAMVTRIWRWLYGRIYHAAARIVVLGPRMKEAVQRNLREDGRGKLVVIPNWAIGDDISPRTAADNPMRRKLGLADKVVVLYSGNMGLAHDMGTLVEAAERLRHVPDLRFLLIGDGGRRQEVESMVKQKGLANVTMLPYQPLETLPYSLTCGDISLVTLEKGIEGLSVPSKLYSSLAAGLAIVAVVGPGSDVADVIEELRCGYRVSQGDAEGLAGAIQALHDDPRALAEMQRRARAGYEQSYTRDSSVGRYVAMLQEVVAGTPPRERAASRGV